MRVCMKPDHNLDPVDTANESLGSQVKITVHSTADETLIGIKLEYACHSVFGPEFQRPNCDQTRAGERGERVYLLGFHGS